MPARPARATLASKACSAKPRGEDRYLPRRPLSTPSQAMRQAQSPRSGRPLHPHHRLAFSPTPRPVPGPRRGLPHPRYRHLTPHPAATSTNPKPSVTKSPSLPLPNGGHQRLTGHLFPISLSAGADPEPLSPCITRTLLPILPGTRAARLRNGCSSTPGATPEARVRPAGEGVYETLQSGDF